jgi:hypothetical protein
MRSARISIFLGILVFGMVGAPVARDDNDSLPPDSREPGPKRFANFATASRLFATAPREATADLLPPALNGVNQLQNRRIARHDFGSK